MFGRDVGRPHGDRKVIVGMGRRDEPSLIGSWGQPHSVVEHGMEESGEDVGVLGFGVVIGADGAIGEEEAEKVASRLGLVHDPVAGECLAHDGCDAGGGRVEVLVHLGGARRAHVGTTTIATPEMLGGFMTNFAR